MRISGLKRGKVGRGEKKWKAVLFRGKTVKTLS
jgi:hypothetical protein